MQIFKKSGESILVAAPIVEVYLPFEYSSNALYQVVGENVRYFGIANFKAFDNESQLEHREKAKTIPLGISAYIDAHPSEVEVADVQFVKDGIYRKCIILRFFKEDAFAVSTSIIKSVDNMSLVLSLLENGKLDNVPATCVAKIIRHAQKINGVNLRLPEEYLRVLVAEKYRDPERRNQKIRYSANPDSDTVMTVNAREDAMLSSTFQGITFEDINTALLVADNRHEAGINEKETVMEQIIKGEKITAAQ